MTIREKAIKRVEDYTLTDIKRCKSVIDRLERKEHLTQKEKETKEMYQDMVDILKEILNGDNIPKEAPNGEVSLYERVIDLLDLLESGLYSVNQAIEESGIRKCL